MAVYGNAHCCRTSEEADRLWYQSYTARRRPYFLHAYWAAVSSLRALRQQTVSDYACGEIHASEGFEHPVASGLWHWIFHLLPLQHVASHLFEIRQTRADADADIGPFCPPYGYESLLFRVTWWPL